MATDNPNDKGSIKDLKKTFEDLGKPMDQILNAIGNMYSEADKLNNAFLQGRTRLDEMNDAVSKAAAGVIRLGGDISDVGNTMIGIADGARRNVIATEDQVSKLYASSAI
jgi:methyl-accepting chemotaxis protein